ncbi:MAG TPA: peroxiredoxin [Acidimicrobiales bacterium]|nr:peroxiredoxin [Acidimicrobiales bacterium]
MAVGSGDVAPNFTLLGTGGKSYSLADWRGKAVVLAFYPGDNTPVCTEQLDSYQSDLSGFASVGAQVFGISPQSVESHDAFSCQQGYGFPLLADTDKAVAAAYGVLGPLGFYRRSVFVVDPEGVIRYVHRSVASLTFKSSTELIEAVKASS